MNKTTSNYFYGNKISDYGIENGYVDYATLAKCFDAVLNNEIMGLTYDIGYWEQVSGTIDNTEEIEELEEKKDTLEEEQEEIENLLEDANDQEENKLIERYKNIECEIEKLENEITDLESEQDQEPEIFQYFIVDDWGGRLLQEVNEIVFYNETLDMYLWGVTHYGTGWDYVLTNIPIEKEA